MLIIHLLNNVVVLIIVTVAARVLEGVDLRCGRLLIMVIASSCQV